MSAVSPRLTVNFLLEDTVLFGGVKVVLRQADLLHRLGHRARIVTPGARPAWYPLQAAFCRVASLDPDVVPAADVQVATYWTTIRPAIAAHGQALHYCQGFEGLYTHNQTDHPQIEDAYSQPIPAVTVSEHLAQLVRERFGRPARVLRQPLEPQFGVDLERKDVPAVHPRILVMSPFEIDWKGGATALRALAQLRKDGVAFDLIRISQWPQTQEERDLYEATEFHCHISPDRVAAVLRSCDLLLAPSWEQEGFGLPVLEAMAAGVPVVASDIGAFRGFAGSAAILVPWDSPTAFAEAAQRVLRETGLWLDKRKRGLQIASLYDEETCGREAVEALRWAASGGWSHEPAGLKPSTTS
ncbi:MAG: glycosyltransferase [Thermoanaerobaculia bacterium]|nr:glycosyltransferase [Thermoanaerobaculia bacterium]